MNFHWPQIFHRTPAPHPHVVVKHFAATKAENKAAQRKRAGVELQLAVYVKQTPPDDRKLETEVAIAALRNAAARAPSIVSKETGE